MKSKTSTIQWTQQFPKAVALLLLLVTAAMPLATAQAQAIKGKDKTKADGAVFQSEKSRKHMQELEQRMLRLADLLKESQPDDAKRLELAVDHSREKRLVGGMMAKVSELIGTLKLSEASAKVDAIIIELKEIKRLLLTADLELEIEKAKIKAINDAIKKIEEIEKQEAKNQEGSDKLAKDGKPNQNAMKGVGKAEEANKDKTGRVEDKVGDIDPKNKNLKNAKKALGEAGKSMGKASKSLGEGKPGEASKSQGKARKDLKKAKEDLEKAKKELQKKIEEKVRAQVLENLRAMLKQQIEIRKQLELVSKDAELGDSRAIVQVRGLADPEKEIIALAKDTIDLCEQTEFSIAMPAALGAVKGRMDYLVDDYSAGIGGAAVVDATKQVEKDLAALIDAMEQSNANQDPPKDGKPKDPREQERREMNKILAELKMLRIMQVATNENVVRLERVRQAGDLPTSTLREREESVRDQQDKVRKATEDLGKRAKGLTQ